jgi:hypothetical protein
MQTPLVGTEQEKCGKICCFTGIIWFLSVTFLVVSCVSPYWSKYEGEISDFNDDFFPVYKLTCHFGPWVILVEGDISETLSFDGKICTIKDSNDNQLTEIDSTDCLYWNTTRGCLILAILCSFLCLCFQILISCDRIRRRNWFHLVFLFLSGLSCLLCIFSVGLFKQVEASYLKPLTPSPEWTMGLMGVIAFLLFTTLFGHCYQMKVSQRQETDIELYSNL